ncbi:hypothetical protein EDF19_1059 [Curtobacterium sp. PhB115]|nr:hypothetical protein EDF19_1059 [Curtobacterium sp. PhB115]
MLSTGPVTLDAWPVLRRQADPHGSRMDERGRVGPQRLRRGRRIGHERQERARARKLRYEASFGEH